MLTRSLRGLQQVLAAQLAVTLLLMVVSSNGLESQAAGDSRALLVGLSTLLLVATSGWRPRLMLPIQLLISVWFLASFQNITDSGDRLCVYLLFLLLPGSFAQTQRGAEVSRWAVRGQMALVYVCAAITKLRVPEWRSGAAFHFYAVDPFNGIVWSPLLHVVDHPGVVQAITWGTPPLELALAASLFSRQRVRRAALLLGVALHGAIAVAFGLVTFSVVMVAGLIILTEPWVPDRPRGAREARSRLSARLGTEDPAIKSMPLA